MNNAFTMFNVIIIDIFKKLSVAVFLQKYNNVLHIYVADHGHMDYSNCRFKYHKTVENLCIKLKSYYTKKLSIDCEYHYIINQTDLQLNQYDHRFDVLPYCILTSHLLMDFLYMNMTVYQNIKYDTLPINLAKYITLIINTFYDIFNLSHHWEEWERFFVNYALRVFGEIGFFHDNESAQVPTYFKHKTLKEIKSGGIFSSIINL